MQAINYYNRAIELDPMNAVFLCNRADAYYNLDNFKVNFSFFVLLFVHIDISNRRPSKIIAGVWPLMLHMREHTIHVGMLKMPWGSIISCVYSLPFC